LYVFALFCPRSEMATLELMPLFLPSCSVSVIQLDEQADASMHVNQEKKLNRSAAYINMKTYKIGNLASMYALDLFSFFLV